MKHLLSLLFLVAFSAPLYAQDAAAPEAEAKPQSLFTTPVVLQIPAETSIGAVWGVNGPAAGFVEYSTKEDLSDAKRVYACVPPLRSIEEKVLSVRIRGLEPNTKYYYRAATLPVDYPNAYKVTVGEPEYSPIHSFTTLGDKAKASFAVINDTHANFPTFKALDKKVKSLNPSVLIWNGDTGEMTTEEHAVQTLLNPGGCAIAEDYGILFVGNHDFRGPWVRNLDKVLIKRNPEERDSKYWSLGRNFAVRMGDVALIGLDTGEDKPDAHPVFQGLAEFEPYRELQTQWLKETLERPEIKNAPFIVAFCHIPIFDKNPNANPGNILEGFASWQKPCSEMWSPLFKQYGVQTVICAHMHHFRYDEPTEDRPWAQFVGGGHALADRRDVATVISGTVEDEELVIRVYKMSDDSVIKEVKFEKRSIK